MSDIKFFTGEQVPVEMHKVRIVQKLNLLSIDERLRAIEEAHYNTFLLKSREVFLDMLTDSGVNAMSDRQLAAMMFADDAYAGSETFYRLEKKVQFFFDKKYFLPAHQGRACENILAESFVKPGTHIPMNYHFTTTKTHINRQGGIVDEIYIDEGVDPKAIADFKGNIDIKKLENLIKEVGANKIPFVRMEMGTNLIGGQPVSLENIIATANVCKKNKIMFVIDASLLSDNLYFIKKREAKYKDWSIHEINLEISKQADIIYFSARKLSNARGGGIVTSNPDLYEKMRELVPLFEGFLTYGGISVREMEAMCVGLDETLDFEVINQGPQFIEAMANELTKFNIPIVSPSGGLGCHLNAMEFVDHIKQEEYPSGALVAAIYLISGVRGMERGTMSEVRNEDGSEHLSAMELVRLALPRRVFTLSQVKYACDRLAWLYKNRHMIGGLRFVKEPQVMRFFLGELEPIGSWPEELVKKFKEDFGDSL